MTRKETDQLFYSITSNGCREMNKVRFHQAINEALIMSNVVDRSEHLKCGMKHNDPNCNCDFNHCEEGW